MIPPVDISKPDWLLLQAILAQQVPDYAVWAFGSRVSGNAKPFSDLDLAIYGDTPLPLAKLAALKESLAESDLPWKVDVVDASRTSDAFLRAIGARRVILQPAAAPAGPPCP